MIRCYGNSRRPVITSALLEENEVESEVNKETKELVNGSLQADVSTLTLIL
jgi:hypothetical protein